MTLIIHARSRRSHATANASQYSRCCAVWCSTSGGSGSGAGAGAGAGWWSSGGGSGAHGWCSCDRSCTCACSTDKTKERINAQPTCYVSKQQKQKNTTANYQKDLGPLHNHTINNQVLQSIMINYLHYYTANTPN